MSPFLILCESIPDCSDNILCANCSDDISKEKNNTGSLFSEFDFAALKAILVARAVFPIEGLPAKTIKSDLFKPPKNPFNLLKPVSTPGNSEPLL